MDDDLKVNANKPQKQHTPKAITLQQKKKAMPIQELRK